MVHKLARCLVAERQLFGNILTDFDFRHCDEICDRAYMDDLGHGINGRLILKRK